jgi:predicted 2-oxoglutarate/Fe(II)-dependent dioxygenase YbiX
MIKAIKSSSKLKNFIKVYDSLLSKEKCNFILNEYVNSNEWRSSKIKNEQLELNVGIRNCKYISISQTYNIEKNFYVRKKIDDLIYKAVEEATSRYFSSFPTFSIESDTGYDLLRYEKGQFYAQHTDSYKDRPRTVSCSIQLNDDYKGGEFAFFDRELKIKSKVGSIIMFPSNFMYPHEVLPVTKGTRYSIVTWLV